MRKILTFIPLLFTLIACERFEDPIPEGSSLEIPQLYAEVLGSNSVSLKWYSGLICQQICPSIVPATKYEIWRKSCVVSANVKIGEVPSGANTFVVADLQPGVPQEFFVIAKRADVSNQTNTVMVAPSRLPTLDPIFESQNFQYITHPMVSGNESRIVYAVSKAGASGNTQNTFLYDLSTKNSELILQNAQFPSWHFGSERLIMTREIGGAFPLEEYTLASSQSNQKARSEVPVYYPVYTSDSTLVFFSFGANEGQKNIISLNLKDGSTSFLRAVDYFENSRAPILGISFNPSSKSIAYGVTFPKDNSRGFAYDIVGFELGSPNRLLNWEVSEWNDTNPSFSSENPDCMAFVSDRSGLEQVWVKNIRSGKLIQVTDFQISERLIPFVVGLSWSGKSLFFNSSGASGDTKMQRVDLSGLL